MADKPVYGSNIVCAIQEAKDANGQQVTVPVYVDTNYTPPRLIVELPDRALRDLGVVTVDGVLAASAETSTVYNGTTALTPKFAVINVSATAEVVAAVASKKIRVLSLALMSAGTATVRLTADTTGTPVALSGLFPLIANVGFVLPFNPIGWCESTTGKNFGLTLSAGVDVDGLLTYVEV